MPVVTHTAYNFSKQIQGMALYEDKALGFAYIFTYIITFSAYRLCLYNNRNNRYNRNKEFKLVSCLLLCEKEIYGIKVQVFQI